MKGFNPLSALVNEFRAFVVEVRAKLDQVITTQHKHTELLEKHTELLEKHTELLEKHTEMLEFLVAELSRFKNDSDSLLVSIFAYCHISGYVASHGEMAHMGKKAARYSRKLGYDISNTQDPRFGEVGLYDPELLRQLFPVENTDDTN